MLQLLLVALLVSGLVAKDAEPEAKAVEPAPAEAVDTPVKDAESAEVRHLHDYNRNYDQDRNDNVLYLKAKLDGHHPAGPVVARNLPNQTPKGHGPNNIAEQDEIIKFTYSPAYYEPVWVLDYRFLKSGGRRFTRGPGGQVLILPRSYRHHKGDGTHDYDSYIEHLRLKLIAEQKERERQHGIGHGHGHGSHGPEYEHGPELGPGHRTRHEGWPEDEPNHYNNDHETQLYH